MCTHTTSCATDCETKPGSLQPSDYPSFAAFRNMDEEHFFTIDMLSLIAGSASPSKDPEAETSNREQASRAPSAPSTSTSGDSSPAQPRPSRGERGICSVRLPLPRKGTSSTP